MNVHTNTEQNDALIICGTELEARELICAKVAPVNVGSDTQRTSFNGDRKSVGQWAQQYRVRGAGE